MIPPICPIPGDCLSHFGISNSKRLPYDNMSTSSTFYLIQAANPMSQGSNSSALRHFNERVVISTIRRQGSASKPELAKLVGLTLQTLTRIVDDLAARGLIVLTGRRTQGVGQPSNIYQINPGSLY